LVADLLAIGIDIQAEFYIVERSLDFKIGVALAPACATAYADVKVLRILANHHEVDIFGSLILEGRPDAFQEFNGPQIHVLIKVEAHGQQYALLQDAGSDPWVSDGTQVDGRKAPQIFECLFAHKLSCLQVVLRSQRVFHPIQGEIVFISCRLQNFLALGYDLRADAVTWDNWYFIIHAVTLATCRLVYSTSPPASTIS
jgi:hypothetical protein